MNSINSLTENYPLKTFIFTGEMEAGTQLIKAIAENHRLLKEKRIKVFIKPFSIELQIFKSFCSSILPLLKRLNSNYDEKPYAEIFPSSTLSLSAVKDREKSERELEQVFGLSVRPSYSIAIKEINVNNEKRPKKQVIIQHTKESNPILMTNEEDNSQESISQLTFDIISTELHPDSSDEETNIQDKELDSDTNSNKDGDAELINNLTKKDKSNQDLIQDEETNEPTNIASENKNENLISEITLLNKEELTPKNKETSPAIVDTNTETQTSKTFNRPEDNSVVPEINTSPKAKKTKEKTSTITIDYIAERIANRSITHTTQFRELIEGHWRYKAGSVKEGNKQLFDVSIKAKGGNIKAPVQDLELLRNGLRDILIEV
ncbi:hypothetical protein [Priestia aryabhattai]